MYDIDWHECIFVLFMLTLNDESRGWFQSSTGEDSFITDIDVSVTSNHSTAKAIATGSLVVVIAMQIQASPIASESGSSPLARG